MYQLGISKSNWDQPRFPYSPDRPIKDYPDITNTIGQVVFSLFEGLMQAQEQDRDNGMVHYIKRRMDPEETFIDMKIPPIPSLDLTTPEEYAVMLGHIVPGSYVKHHVLGQLIAASGITLPNLGINKPHELFNFGGPQAFPEHLLPQDPTHLQGLKSGYLAGLGQDPFHADLPRTTNPHGIPVVQPALLTLKSPVEQPIQTTGILAKRLAPLPNRSLLTNHPAPTFPQSTVPKPQPNLHMSVPDSPINLPPVVPAPAKGEKQYGKNSFNLPLKVKSLRVEQADYHWLNGEGQALIVPLKSFNFSNTINLMKLKKFQKALSIAKSNPRKIIKTELITEIIPSLSDFSQEFLVLGNIALNLQGYVTVSEDHNKWYFYGKIKATNQPSDIYDFNPSNRQILKEAYVRYRHSQPGTAFAIYLSGESDYSAEGKF